MASEAEIQIEIKDSQSLQPVSLDSPPASSLTNPYHAGYLFKAGMVYGCVPTWKHRWCIVKGGYLFKYSSPNGSKPKGTPIALTDCDIEMCDLPPTSANAYTPKAYLQYMMSEASSEPLPDLLFGIRITSIVNEYTFGAISAEQQRLWVQKLRAHKQLAIKQQMGHVPVSADEKFAAKSGALLVTKHAEREAAEAASLSDRSFGHFDNSAASSGIGGLMNPRSYMM